MAVPGFLTSDLGFFCTVLDAGLRTGTKEVPGLSFFCCAFVAGLEGGLDGVVVGLTLRSALTGLRSVFTGLRSALTRDFVVDVPAPLGFSLGFAVG